MNLIHKTTPLWLFIVWGLNLYSQNDSNVTSNVIILVDEKVVIEPLARLKLEIFHKGLKTDYSMASYSPGQLSYDQSKKIDIFASDSTYLSFDYYRYNDNKQFIKRYEIKLNKVWLNSSYLIIRIYNLDNKRYKRIFFPLPGKNYTYEVDSPVYPILRIKRKKALNTRG